MSDAATPQVPVTAETDAGFQNYLKVSGLGEPSTPAEPAVTASQHVETTVASEPSGETVQGYDAAVKQLQFDGYKAEILKKLAPSEVVELGEAAKRRNASFETKLAELRKPQTTEKAAQTEAAEATPAPPDAKDARVQQFTQLFGDEEAAKAIVGLINEQTNAATKELRAELAQARKMAITPLVEKARSELGERFPGIKDKAKFQAEVDPYVGLIIKNSGLGDNLTSDQYRDVMERAMLAAGWKPTEPVKVVERHIPVAKGDAKDNGKKDVGYERYVAALNGASPGELNRIR
jgi:hypothetical protein